MIDWKSAWNQWPKPASEFLPALHAAVTKQPRAGDKRAPSLRDPLVQLIMNTNNAAQRSEADEFLFDALRAQFSEEGPRRALHLALAAQVDLAQAVQVSEMWAVKGPVAASSSEGKPWLTPFHPGVEVAIYARLHHELGEPAAGRDLMGGLHLALRELVNQTHGPRKNRAGRMQVIAGWEKFLASSATSIFGFPAIEGWAKKIVKVAASRKTDDMPPDFADAYRALVAAGRG